jgi:AraC family transcriptional regulator of adaptative response/methylated-DNA-[protein]-cysteine methyltransferase
VNSRAGSKPVFERWSFDTFDALEGKSIVLCKYFDSPLGVLLACASSRGLCLLVFADDLALSDKLSRLRSCMNVRLFEGSNIHLAEFNDQLDSYFENGSCSFSIAADLPGTEQEKRIWAGISAISPGRFRSCEDLAKNCGVSVAEVIRAILESPLEIVIPSHRVLGLHLPRKFAGSILHRFAWLLAHEWAE